MSAVYLLWRGCCSLLIDWRQTAFFKHRRGSWCVCRGPTEVAGVGGRADSPVLCWQGIKLVGKLLYLNIHIPSLVSLWNHLIKLNFLCKFGGLKAFECALGCARSPLAEMYIHVLGTCVISSPASPFRLSHIIENCVIKEALLGCGCCVCFYWTSLPSHSEAHNLFIVFYFFCPPLDRQDVCAAADGRS